MDRKEKVDSIVHAEYVLPMDEGLSILRDGAVAVSGGRIVSVGSFREISREYQADKVLGGSGRVIFPGLVNTHTHAAMVLFRGLADDLPLKEWLEHHIWPAEAKWLGPEFISDAIELACLEMLKAGITAFHDMYFFGDITGITAKRMGMRAVLGVGILDFPTKVAETTDQYFEKAEVFIRDWKGDDLIHPSIAPHALYTCGPDTLRRAKELAEAYDIPIHIHLSETQWEIGEILLRYAKRPVHHLESIGFLSERVLAAHCVWLEDEEIDILARRRVNVSHCVESNLKLASGIAPVTKMLKAGIRVTFGTDGAASNNDLNVLSEMSTAAKLHKAVSNDPTALDAKTAMLMATRWGAEALGLGGIAGSIKAGNSADLVVANLARPHLIPLYDIYSHIVYSMRASDVETVMVGGEVVVEDGSFRNGDEAAILNKAGKWGERIRNR